MTFSAFLSFFSHSLICSEGCEMPEIKITTCNEIFIVHMFRSRQSEFSFKILADFITKNAVVFYVRPTKYFCPKKKELSMQPPPPHKHMFIVHV